MLLIFQGSSFSCEVQWGQDLLARSPLPLHTLHFCFWKAVNKKCLWGQENCHSQDSSLFLQDTWVTRKNFLALAQIRPLGAPRRGAGSGAGSAMQPCGTTRLPFIPKYPSGVWRQRVTTTSPLPNTRWPPFLPSDRHPVAQRSSVFQKPSWNWESGPGTSL